MGASRTEFLLGTDRRTMSSGIGNHAAGSEVEEDELAAGGLLDELLGGAFSIVQRASPAHTAILPFCRTARHVRTHHESTAHTRDVPTTNPPLTAAALCRPACRTPLPPLSVGRGQRRR